MQSDIYSVDQFKVLWADHRRTHPESRTRPNVKHGQNEMRRVEIGADILSHLRHIPQYGVPCLALPPAGESMPYPRRNCPHRVKWGHLDVRFRSVGILVAPIRLLEDGPAIQLPKIMERRFELAALISPFMLGPIHRGWLGVD